MSTTSQMKMIAKEHLLLLVAAGAALLGIPGAHAAAPGIINTGTAGQFQLTAQAANITQPDGQMVYSWGYGCVSAPPASSFKPATSTAPFCSPMQIPGPTLIVTEGSSFTVTLTNNLPAPAGNTSILFPGLQVTGTSGGVAGLLTQEAANGAQVTYTVTATTPGTHSYYSGTQQDLQIEMGMYGAIIVVPAGTLPTCPAHNLAAGQPDSSGHMPAAGEADYRLASSAYHLAQSCYDREYLFQFAEMDPNIHLQALAQVNAALASGGCAAGAGSAGCNLQVPTEPYHPAYFMINGRSMPDDMDTNYASQYPYQPYNGNPHMHPGDLVLLRIIGQGRWQHPFHEHGNHVRILARDGNLITDATGKALAGPLLFTTTTTPGQTMDGIFYWTGRGLNWDPYGHHPTSADPVAKLPCTADVNGYNTGDLTAVNYYEWCADHNKPMQAQPFGDVPGGGPVTLPDPNLFTNGAWYGGSPYLGPNATARAVGATGTTPPSGTIANSPSGEAGFAFMWHSHNEREITTNNIFPGGMFMMMLVDSREFAIDESN